jgi:hypothetical protein
MASQDLEAFIRERAAVWDDTGDYAPGSPFDLKLIQPLLRRLGVDPFTVDFFTFAQTRINETHPDVPTKEGDAITDLLIKIAMVLWDPILREIIRVRRGQSLRDPEILTVEEAEALCANIFSQRNTGHLAKGRVRLFFVQPQNASVSPANFCISKTGLHFSPTKNQSISVDEMLFNRDASGVYYFDIDVIAERPGDAYNIAPDEIVTIANLPSTVRVTNLTRFRFGLPEEDAVTFIDRTEQELTERSMVTLRGILARVTAAFPEVTRIGVIGFNDPEMQRDVVQGGGLGPMKAMGSGAVAVPDGENKPMTRRLDMSVDLLALSTDLNALVGPSNVPPSGWVMTVFNGNTPPYFQDVDVLRVVSTTQLDLAQQVVPAGLINTPFGWAMRRRELTLSRIPGGILFPDGPNGTVTIPDDVIHIGGATDVLVRGTDLDTSTLVIEDLTDDTPLLQGIALTVIDAEGNVTLGDVVLDVTPTYLTGGSVYQTLARAAARNLSLQILDNPVAGTYRVLGIIQALGASPILTIDPPPPQAVGAFRWRLLDEIDVDLTEPRETRVGGVTMASVQGLDLLETAPATDFVSLGVAVGDVVRLANGADAGDFGILAVLPTQIQVDRVLTTSSMGLTFSIFRRNGEGGVVRPFARVTAIDLLDTSGQPVGSKVPYAKAVDARSNAFANFAHGVKADVRDARLGIVSLAFPSGANVSGKDLFFTWENGGPQSLAFTGVNPLSVDDMIEQINDGLTVRAAYKLEGNRIGITLLGGTTAITGGSARPVLFGTPDENRSSRDIRSNQIEAAGGWGALSPEVDAHIDVAQVLDGYQIGFFEGPVVVGHALTTSRDFAPEASRHVQVGSRSVGTVRVFFLEPTSISFTRETRFTARTATGIPLRFLPDPTVGTQRIPALPSGDKPKDGVTDSLDNTLTSNAVDFLKKGIQPGDELTIDFVPLIGVVALPDPVPNLATNPLTYLQLTVDNVDRVVNFVHDNVAIPQTSVTRGGVADQINQVVGRKICRIVQVGGSYYLEFEFDGSVVVRRTGTANTFLGFSVVVDQNNDSPHKGTYSISTVAPHALTVTSLFPNNPIGGTVGREQYKVFRPGLQRFGATQMAAQKGDAGLYYVDAELVSEGTGDLWNITAGMALTVEGYESDGYWLTTDDANLTFSAVEPVRLHLSRSILEVGVSDDFENATQLSGQNIQISYERSALTFGVSNFVTAETERVVCESPLVRHLIPYFVRFDMAYSGGSKTDVVVPEVERYIRALLPDDFLEVSDIEGLLSAKGATSITNPVTLVAVVHNFDRTVTVERSQDRLNTGRLAAFIPDGVNITRKAG